MTELQTPDITTWKSKWGTKKFQLLLLLWLSGLFLCSLISPFLFHYVQEREGILLSDPVLNFLPFYDLSLIIFIILYFFITISIVYLIMHPADLLLGLQAYLWLTIFRFVTLILFPLDAPMGIIELRDPIVDQFFYQRSVTKDLFFSGHTSAMFLLSLLVKNRILQPVLFGVTLIIAIMLLIQHAHYFIDIIAAPFFAWAAYTLAKKISERFGYRNI